jgi:predicted lipase
MGAALSVIFGIEFKLRHSNVVVEIQNLGCPRVGNPSFAQFVQTKVDRVNRLVHNRDIVPHLPPLEKGYHHAAY